MPNSLFALVVMLAFVGTSVLAATATTVAASGPVHEAPVAPAPQASATAATPVAVATSGAQPAPSAASAPASKEAFAYLPMAREGEIRDNREFAKRMRASLKKDPAGNTMIVGANTTPLGFYAAMKMADAKVEGIAALPDYIESLREDDAPTGTIVLSRVEFQQTAAGVKTYKVDTKTGFAREATKKERGYYDANTNNLVFLSNCFNSPLKPTVKTLGGTPAPPRVALAASAPPAFAASVPTVVGLKKPTCPAGKKVRIIVWPEKAALYSDVAALIADVEKADEQGALDPSMASVSRVFNDFFEEEFKAGRLRWSERTVTVTVIHFGPSKGKEGVELLKDQQVTGMYLFNLPAMEAGDYIDVQFAGHRLSSPNKNLLRGHTKEYPGCVTRMNAIEGKLPT